MPFQSIERQINVFFHPIRRGVLFDCYLGGESFCSYAFFQGFFFRYVVFLLSLFTVLQHFPPIWTDLWAVKQFLGSATLWSHQDERSLPTFCSGFLQKLLSKHKLTFCYRSACLTFFFHVLCHTRHSSHWLQICGVCIFMGQEEPFVGSRSYIQRKHSVNFGDSKKMKPCAFIYPLRH